MSSTATSKLQVRACSDIIRRNSTAAWAYVSRAWAYLDQGQLDQAIADTTKAIQINPRNAAAYHNRAAAYHRKADYDRTIADATKAIQFNPRLALAYATATLAASAIPIPALSNIIVSLLTSLLYDLIKPREKWEVVVGDDTVTIRGGDFQVAVPRQAYELKPRIEHDPKVVEGIERTLAAVKKDPAVETLGVGVRPDASPAVVVPRKRIDEALQRLAEGARSHGRDKSPITVGDSPAVSSRTHEKKDRTTLTVIKGGLQHGRSKWGFSWQGVPVSAPITDAILFAELKSRDVAVRLGIADIHDDFRTQLPSPSSVRLQVGDELDADLTITQRLHPEAEVWVNHAYSVSKVYRLRRGGVTIEFSSSARSARLTPNAAGPLPPTVGDADGRV